MRNLVVIPCYRRPEFLAATLRCIEQAHGADEQEYLFAIDRNHDPLIDEVIATFKFLPNAHVTKRSHTFDGPAYNILEAYREASHRQDIEIVYVIEEDVFVAEDYFQFHEAAHDLDDEAAFVCACRNQNLATPPAITDETGVYRHVSYQSPGTSLSRWFLSTFLEHANRQYYRSPISYCEMRLPDSGLPRWAASQDGLIHRVIRRDVRWGMYAATPRAFHAGFYGQNRDGRPLDGHWRDVSERLLSMSADQMNERADPAFRDITRCELIRSAVPLKLV